MFTDRRTAYGRLLKLRAAFTDSPPPAAVPEPTTAQFAGAFTEVYLRLLVQFFPRLFWTVFVQLPIHAVKGAFRDLFRRGPE